MAKKIKKRKKIKKIKKPVDPRSPISIISDFCIAKNERPAVYEFISRESACNKLCQVKFWNEIVIGQGRSKKKAKRAAAQNLITHLCSRFPRIRLQPTSHGDRLIDESDPPKRICPLQVNNFIGRLAEHCQKNVLEPPAFNMRRVSLRQALFIGTCLTGDLRESELGMNKKRVKQMAAKKVLDILLGKQWQRSADFQADDRATRQMLVDTKLNSLHSIFKFCMDTNISVPAFRRWDTDNLYKYCHENNYGQPVFTNISLPGSNSVTMLCEVNSLKVQESHKSNERARWKAAGMMYLALLLIETKASRFELPDEKIQLKKQKRKRNTESAPTKNYTGELLAYCVHKKLERPLFKETEYKRDKQGHSKFYFECSVDGAKSHSEAGSKIEARRNVSKLMLGILHARKGRTKSASTKNYTGFLLEHCVKQGIPLPFFDDVSPVNKEGRRYEKNEDDKLLFRIRCMVNNLEFVGMATTKMQARRVASELALKQLLQTANFDTEDDAMGETDENQTVENQTLETVAEEEVPMVRSPGTDNNQQTTPSNDNRVVDNMEVDAAAASPVPLFTDNNQQSNQIVDQVVHHEVVDVAEEFVHQFPPVADNESMEVDEAAASPVPPVIDDNQQSTQNVDNPAVHHEDVDVAEESVQQVPPVADNNEQSIATAADLPVLSVADVIQQSTQNIDNQAVGIEDAEVAGPSALPVPQGTDNRQQSTRHKRKRKIKSQGVEVPGPSGFPVSRGVDKPQPKIKKRKMNPTHRQSGSVQQVPPVVDNQGMEVVEAAASGVPPVTDNNQQSTQNAGGQVVHQEGVDSVQQVPPVADNNEQSIAGAADLPVLSVAHIIQQSTQNIDNQAVDIEVTEVAGPSALLVPQVTDNSQQPTGSKRKRKSTQGAEVAGTVASPVSRGTDKPQPKNKKKKKKKKNTKHRQGGRKK